MKEFRGGGRYGRRIDPRVRFFDKIIVNPETGCWEWQASKNKKGYGQFNPGGGGRGSNHLAHRVAYEFVRGPIPEGQSLDHLCRNRACVNPGHLEVVSFQENVRRRDASRLHHCPCCSLRVAI